MTTSTRRTTVTASMAVLISLLIVLLAQMSLLGALGWGGNAHELSLHAAANAQPDPNAHNLLQLTTGDGPAVVQQSGLTLTASDILALRLHTDEVVADTRMTLGWLSTRDLRRSAAAEVGLNPDTASNGDDDTQTIMLLVGNPGWRDTITRVALALNGPPNTLRLQRAEWISANPAGALYVMGQAWFARTNAVVKPENTANRLLPLTFWFAIAAPLAFVFIALVYRRKPEQRAVSLRIGAWLLTLIGLALLAGSNVWPGWSMSIGAGLATMAALYFAAPFNKNERRFTNRFSTWHRLLLALMMLAIAALLSRPVAAVAVAPLVMLAAHSLRRGPWAALGAFLLAILLLLICAVTQNMLPTPVLLEKPTDPTNALAQIGIYSVVLPGFILGLFTLHTVWPAVASARRWSLPAASASAWALGSALLVLTVPRITIQLGGMQSPGAYIALFLPFLAALAFTLRPKLDSVAHSVEETAPVIALTEADLSSQAITLLEGHGGRMREALRRNDSGAAHRALRKMQQIAPAAHATALACLQIALHENQIEVATIAASQLEKYPFLKVEDYSALLELAHLRDDHQRVIELAPLLLPDVSNRRALATAQLLSGDHDAALRTLSLWLENNVFAREIAELHLLANNVKEAQQAMWSTGIKIDEPIGEAYIARLAMRVQDAETQQQTILRLTTWYPQLAPAQAAHGELLLRQGNHSGGEARLRVALRLDPLLWPIRAHFINTAKKIDTKHTA